MHPHLQASVTVPRSLQGLTIHQENKLEKLQSSKFIKWSPQTQSPPWPTPSPSPTSDLVAEPLSPAQDDHESWDWQSALNNPSLMAPSEQMPMDSQDVLFLSDSVVDLDWMTPSPSVEDDLEERFNIIDYCLDDQYLPDLKTDNYLSSGRHIDRGERCEFLINNELLY